MRIDITTRPNTEGKSPEDAIKILSDYCHDIALLVMRLNNEVESLKKAR